VTSALKSAPLVLALMLGAATVADAGGHRHPHVYGHATPQGYRFVTPAGNIVTVPFSTSVAPSGGTREVETPQGTTSGTYRDERPGPHRNGFEGTSPRCQRFFC
jgi:hypothetical protein